MYGNFFFLNCHAVRDRFGVKSLSVSSASGLLAADGEEDVGELGDEVRGEDIAPGDTDPNLGDRRN